jgi:hypothetical protein
MTREIDKCRFLSPASEIQNLWIRVDNLYVENQWFSKLDT